MTQTLGPAQTETTRSAAAAALVAFGTAGASRLRTLLAALEEAGALDAIGAIGLAEFDQHTVQRVLAELPGDADHLRQRIVTIGHAAFESGFGSATPNEVAAPAMAGIWRPELATFIDRLTLRQRQLQPRSTVPGLIVAFPSLGGHLEVSIEGLALLRQHHPRALIVACVAIPHEPLLRRWSRQAVERIRATGVDVVILQDDRIAAQRDDRATAHLLSTLLAGYSIANGQLVAANNKSATLSPLGRRQQGHLAILSSASTLLPAEALYYDPEIGQDYGVGDDVLQMEILDGIHRMQTLPGHSSTGCVPPGGRLPDTHALRAVRIGVEPASLLRVAGKVRVSLLAGGQLDWGTELIFASTRQAPPARPSDALCPLEIVEVVTVARPDLLLDTIFSDERAASTSAPAAMPATPAMTAWQPADAPAAADPLLTVSLNGSVRR